MISDAEYFAKPRRSRAIHKALDECEADKKHTRQQKTCGIVAEEVNRYWLQRGVEANARAEEIRVKLHRVARSKIVKHKDGTETKTHYWVPLDPPRVVRSWEVVSDLAAMVTRQIELGVT